MLFVPLFTAKEVKTTKEGDLDPEAKAPFENSALATIFNVVRYLTFLGLYIGFGAVCVGVFKYEPPAGVWSTKSKVELRVDVSLLELLVGGRWGFRYCNVIMNCHRYIHVLYDNELNSRIYTSIRFWGPEILLLIPRLCLTWCSPAAHSCAFKTIYGDRSL